MGTEINRRRVLRRQAAAKFKRAADARLTVMDPLFNYREIAKQMLLLEDHLHHTTKHCPDCVRKHLMTIEAFAEEATTLDVKQEYTDSSEQLARAARVWMMKFSDGTDLHALAQEIRKIRKVIVEKCHDPRKPSERVAAVYLARGVHNH